MAEYKITFSDENLRAAGEKPTYVTVDVRADFGVDLTAETVDEAAELLVEYAVLVWKIRSRFPALPQFPSVDWTADEPGWFASYVTLPNGDVVELG